MSDMKTLTIGAQTWSMPVTSVNGQTGDVVLGAADVGAATEQDIADAIIQVLPVDSASGAVASFPDGADNVPVEALSVTITPVQDLHGQTSPYPAGGGVNKLPPSSSGTMTDNGITLKSNGDGTYTVTGSTSGTSANVYFDLTAEHTIESGDYLHMNNSVANSSVEVDLDKTGGGNIVYPAMTQVNRIVQLSGTSIGKAVGRIRVYVAANQTNVNITIKPMICQSSTAIAFAPYANICPITGWNEAKVTRTGSNLWDEQWEQGFIATASGQNISGTGIRSKNMCACSPSTVYYAYFGSGGSRYVFWYKADGTYISNAAFSTKGILTSPSEARFFRIRIDTITTYANDASLNYPSTDTTYHAHSIQTVTIDLSGTRYGGTLDVLTGVLTVTHKMFAPTGTGDYADGNVVRKSGVATKNSYYFAEDVTIKKGHDVNPTSNIFAYGGFEIPVANSVDNTFFYYGSQLRFTLPMDSAMTSADAVNAWFASQYALGTPIQFLVELATPLSVQLDANTLTTLLGQNNVWSNCGDVAVSYRADIQRYIEKKLS